MINTERNIYWAKYIFYVTSFVWVLYLFVFSHELGHAITVVALGGTVREFVVSWDLTGYVVWTGENIPASSFSQVRVLVGVSGGIGAMLFFLALSYKSKWFVIPALFSLMGGFGEAMFQTETRLYATNGTGVAVIFICAMLFWQFETRERNKRIEKIGPRRRAVPEHIYEKAMRALEKCADRLEEEHNEFKDLEEILK